MDPAQDPNQQPSSVPPKPTTPTVPPVDNPITPSASPEMVTVTEEPLPLINEETIPPVITTPPSPSRPRAKIVGTILAVLILVIGIPAGILLVGQSQETRERAEEHEGETTGGAETDISGPSQEEIDAADINPGEVYEQWVSDGGSGKAEDFKDYLKGIEKPYPDDLERYGYSNETEQKANETTDHDPNLYDQWVRRGGSGKVEDFKTHLSEIRKQSPEIPGFYGYQIDKEREIVDRDPTLYDRWVAERGRKGDREAFKKHLDKIEKGGIGKMFPTNPERYGFKPEPIGEATGDEEEPAFTAQCLNIKVYNTNWNQLSAIQLPDLKKGDSVRFAVVGGNSHGTVDKARFRINDGTWQETANKNPNNEYYFAYTIPQVTIQTVPPPPITTKVEAQIHLKETNQWF